MSADLFEERLAKVRNRFVSTLPGKLDETNAALPLLSGLGAAVVEAVAETYRRMHGIAGTGPTVGFPATGQAARNAEAVLIAANREQRGLSEEEAAEFKTAFDTLRDIATTELQTKADHSV